MLNKKKNDNSKYVMLLMIDGTIKKVAPDKLPDYRLISYLLIPLEGFLSTSYICVKSNPYINFDKVVICSDIDIEFYSDGFAGEVLHLNNSDVEITNINDLYNYLHSILRYERSNVFTGSYVSEILPSDIYIEFKFFEIEIYKNDDLIYYKKEEGNHGRNLSASDLLDFTLTDVYPPMYKEFNMAKTMEEMIVISNNTWKKKKFKKIKDNDLVGIFGPYMKTVSFIDMDSFNAIRRNVKGFTLSMYIIDENKNPIDECISSGELHDLLESCILPIKSCYMWVNDPVVVMEIFDMVQIYSVLFKTILAEFHRINYPELFATMKMKAYWIFCMDFNSYRHPSEIISVNDDTPTTIGDFINAIKSIERELE